MKNAEITSSTTSTAALQPRGITITHDRRDGRTPRPRRLIRNSERPQKEANDVFLSSVSPKRTDPENPESVKEAG